MNVHSENQHELMLIKIKSQYPRHQRNAARYLLTFRLGTLVTDVLLCECQTLAQSAALAEARHDAKRVLAWVRNHALVRPGPMISKASETWDDDPAAVFSEIATEGVAERDLLGDWDTH